MPVFISHRTADDYIARRVYLRLKFHHNIECYIDDIDGQLRQASGTAAVTGLIIRRVNECTNLLAIVTENTKGSWWVPFEVGVARQAPRIITTYTNQSDGDMPEYLLEWPRLRGENAIDLYAEYYKRQRVLLESRVLKKRGTEYEQRETVDSFHRQLKTALRQP